MHDRLGNSANRLIVLVLAVWLPIFALLAFERQLELASGLPISWKTANINLLGVSSLLAGILFSRGMVPRRKSHKAVVVWGRSADLALLSILLTGALIGAYLSVGLWRELGIDVLNVSGRTLYEMNVIHAAEDRVITGVAGRLTAISFVGLMYALYLLREGRLTIKVGGAFAVAFLLAMISPRRALLLTSLISLLMMWFLSAPRIRITQILKFSPFIVLILAFFGFTQFLLQKSQTFSITDSLRIVLDYYISSFYVMDALIDTPHFEETYILWSVPERILALLLEYTPNVNLSVPFVYVSGQSNTVPAFYYFFKSSGYLGVFLASFLIGWVFMRLYMAWRSSLSFFHLVAASLFAAGVVLSPRQCLFIEYDFLFFLAISWFVGWLRQGGRKRPNVMRGPLGSVRRA